MWRLTFPWFLLKLVFLNISTIVHVSVFRLTENKVVVANIFLTTVAGILALSLWQLPAKSAPLNLRSRINLEENESSRVTILTMESNQVRQALLEYEQAVREKTFIPQYDYVNLAILAQKAGEAEKANQYLNLAKSIDPNQSFFRE